ncbi:MAG: aminoacyl-tRNA hydrolase [Lachnospiraceae bacterium]|nr:aminoacyl-tRNA hydrolase [Lachnospiraceae bacterium]
MYIVVGLGNPTKQYENTRHNIGFMTIDEMADRYGISVTSIQHKARIGKGIINGHKVILAEPLTYMNLSGESVRALADYFKVDYSSEVIIISDDIELPPGYIRVRPKGSAGGHNGLKNIIQHLGTEEFIRVRVGVGEKPKKMDLAEYVLGHFPPNEMEDIKSGISQTIDAINLIMDEKISDAMNQFNRKVKKDSAESNENKTLK